MSEAMQSSPVDLRALALAAKAVMDDLDKYGPSIVPHLIDTDENDGQRLRDLIEAALRAVPAEAEEAQEVTDSHEPRTADLPGTIPADAITSIKTLPHITVDKMLGLWVSLDQVEGLLERWTTPWDTERTRTDLAETLCFLWPQDEHRNHVAKGFTTCEASRGFADRIVRALAARYSVRYAKVDR